MKRIVKFEMQPGTNVSQRVHYLKPVYMAFQQGTLCAWFEEYAHLPVDKPQEFYVAVTGEQVDSNWQFVATAMTQDQDFVCHLFEVRP